MSQHDYVIANGTGAAVRSDLNNALAAIVSNNSGATEPATMYAYQWWADTSTGLLKLRNAANNAWITLRELDGTLTIEDGTASSPGLAFADDLNTGIYSPSADQLGITTGGTVRLTTTTTGITSALPVDVPLGTASAPTVTFTGDLNTGIYSPGADQVAISTNGSQRLTVSTTGVTSTLPVDVALGSVTAPTYSFTGDLNTGMWSPAADTVAISTGGSERVRVTSSGQWLVGTSTARGVGSASTWKMQIEGLGTDTGYPGLGLTNNTNDNECAYIVLAKTRGTSIGSSTIVQNNDNLGVIAFAGADGTDIETRGAEIRCAVDGTPGANDLPTRLVFSTTADGASSPTERMRIDNAGRLLVGTTDTSAVSGVAVVYKFATNASTSWGHVVENSSSTPRGITVSYPGAAPNGTTNEFLYCFDSSAQRAAIRSNGGLANYSANNANLSDRNAKKDITPAAGTWDCIKEWEIVNYRYKDQPDDADLNLGVIAQQVAESCPEVITVFQEASEDEPEKLGVKEQQMYWMAIKALQEAQVRIETLEAEVAALKAQ